MDRTKLRMLHLNCQSINNDSKIIEIENLLRKHKIHIFSLNETFLKPKCEFDIEGFNIYRSDRTNKKGGGAAIGVIKGLVGKPISLEQYQLADNAIGYEITLKNDEKLQIFSIYSSPGSPLNKDLFDHIFLSFKNVVVLGDLNACSKLWFCKSENKKGAELEAVLAKFSLHSLNRHKPTFKRSKNVLDLSICSDSII